LTINKSKISIVLGISYDPNRTNFASLSFDIERKKFFYSNALSKITSGSLRQIKENIAEIKLGYRSNLLKIPAGNLINNLCIPFNKKSTYIKAAGTFGQLIQVSKNVSRVKLPSGKILTINSKSFATLGTNSNEKHDLVNLGKAGRNRNKGRRPIVRGIAMNPVDHPHGGRTNGGKPSVTPWGLPTKSKFYLKPKKQRK
jgi:large subunit ribosomal protein L2